MATLSEPSLFQSLFQPALDEYEKQTGINLIGHPLAIKVEACNLADSESVILVIQEGAQAFQESRWDNNKVMQLVKHSVQVLHKISTYDDSVNIPISLVKMIYTCIGILLATVQTARATKEALINLFESIWNLLKRLDIYTKVPLKTTMADLVMKILIQLIPTLAVATKQLRQGRLKILGKNICGEIDIETVLQRLDRLNQEEARIAAAQTLEVVYGLVQNIRVVMDDGNASTDIIRDALGLIQQVVSNMNKSKREELQQHVRSWLSPPDPWKNHNIACEARHPGTTAWFIQSDTFSEWKSCRPSSLLWIHGKRKSVVCSSVIQDIVTMQKSGLASLAFFYCDFQDDRKKNKRGLLSSVLTQLSHQSDAYCDVLSTFYLEHARGAQHPSDTALVKCLKDVLKLAGQPPVYLIVDAVDECPNTSVMPSPREQILGLVEELIDSQLHEVHVCVTSRSEVDIKAVLEPLTFRSVCLHDESGQMEDISNYIKSIVFTDRRMRTWKTEDKQLAINVLTKNANGMFRWAYCQLVHLRGCLPGRIRHTLSELPETLDDTYRRTLLGINKTNWEFAHYLLQCASVASRPLRVEELSQFLAFDFKTGSIPRFHEGWRTEDPVDAILSTCPSLLSIVNVEDSQVIQFSHFSVKEYLMSTRLAEESDINFRRYHVSMSGAHTLVARACLGMLLQLDKNTTGDSLQRFPLAEYAAEHWIDHARFGDVSCSVEDGMKDLFHPGKRHFAIWVWIYDPADPFYLPFNRDKKPPHPRSKTLHYAALYGLPTIVKFLIVQQAQNINCRDLNDGSTPLHRASCEGHSDVVFLLLQYGANAAVHDKNKWTALHWASYRGHLETVRILLDHGVDVKAQDKDGWTPLHRASFRGYVDVVCALLERGADINALDSHRATPLHRASDSGHVEVIGILLVRGADFYAEDKYSWTALDRAVDGGHVEAVRILFDQTANLTTGMRPVMSGWPLMSRSSFPEQRPLYQRSAILARVLFQALNQGHVEIVRFLLERGADPNVKDKDGWTPLKRALEKGEPELVRVLLEHGANPNIRDKDGWTPLRQALEKGEPELVRVLLEHGADANANDKDGWTPLKRALKTGQVEIVRVLLERGANPGNGWTPPELASILEDPNTLDLVGSSPLHRASDGGYAEIVRILHYCGADLHARDKDRLTALHWASDRGHEEVVRILLDRGADLDARDKDRLTALHRASDSGHVEVVRILLNRGADLDARDKDLSTALHLASYRGHVEVIQVLLECGADPNAEDEEGWTAVHWASDRGHIEIVRILFDRGADLDAHDKGRWTALNRASEGGHVEVVRYLVDHGAALDSRDEDRLTSLHWASERGHVEVIRVLLGRGADLDARDKDQLTALHRASNWGHVEAVRVLLERGADPDAKNKSGWTPLHFASNQGHVDVVRVLLGREADSATCNEYVDTPLHEASKMGHIEVVQVLLDRGANPKALDEHGWTPLHRASDQGHVEVVRVLLDRGADPTLCIERVETESRPSQRASKGETSLHLASKKGHLGVVRVLIERGTDLTAQDESGQTALHWASSQGHIEVIRVLLEHGANPRARDKDGVTPLRLSTGRGAEVARLLREYCATSMAQNRDRT